MKIIILFISIFAFQLSNAQEFKIEDKTLTGIFEVKEKTKAQIFTSINKWVSINYNSAKNVIQMNELESGILILKGINEVSYKNPSKVTMPNNKYVSEFTTANFAHLVEINIKDNKYRIIFKIITLAQEDLGFNETYMNCINLSGAKDSAVQNYNDELDKAFKNTLVSVGKREKLKEFTKPMFEEINTKLLVNLKALMLSIEKSFREDGW